MSDSLTAKLEPTFVCDCEGIVRSACAGEPFYREHEGKRYCVLHFPGKEKAADFDNALQRKLKNKNFNFRGVWFPDRLSLQGFHFDGDVDFSSATFSAPADFSAAIFTAAAVFRSAKFPAAANFNSATFSVPASFSSATFRAADFSAAVFSAEVAFRFATFSEAVDFRYAKFRATATFLSAKFRAAVDFRYATFSDEASFRSATFSAAADFRSAKFPAAADFSSANFSAAADFRYATLGSYFKFAGDEENPVSGQASSLSLQFARIEKPDRVSFHTLRLRPHCFVNVDARKFEFTNVNWRLTTSQEIKDLSLPKEKKIWHSGEYGLGASTHQLLAIAFRHLAVNAEENHRYEEASKFRYMAMDVRRRELWHGLAVWRLSWWYWLASGYGERVSQAFLVLLGILLLSAVLYTQVGFARWEPRLASQGDVATAKRDEVGMPLPFARALAYSAGVLTFQRPEPRPTTRAAQFVVLLETILGPVQAALLALAIRRKFMR